MTIRINTSYAYIIIIRDSKVLVLVIGTDPDLSALYERKDIPVADSIKTSNNNKPFVVFDKLCDVFSKKREWWICNNNIRFFQNLYTFRASKVSVTDKGSFYWLITTLT